MGDPDLWVRIGHRTDDAGRTGCTVILFKELVPATVDVRGGAPGTRETDLLGSGRLVARVDAIVLTGGSAFGLAAADGVMRYLSEQGRGIPTRSMAVPIVPAAVIYDLAHGLSVWPMAGDGYQAAVTATAIEVTRPGRIGAGTGATVAKLGDGWQEGGLGIATVGYGTIAVTAVVVLNAIGDVIEPTTGRYLARAIDPDGRERSGRELILARSAAGRSGENTTIGTMLIDGAVDRDCLQRCCIAAHDALARCVIPAHTIFDGDTFFAAARNTGATSPTDTLGIATATELAVEQAIVGIFGDQSDPDT